MMTVRSLPGNAASFVGDGTTHPISATTLLVKWVQIVTASGNAFSVLIGGPEVTSSIGFPIPTGWAGQLLPDLAGYPSPEPYDLSKINYNAGVGDKFYILYGA